MSASLPQETIDRVRRLLQVHPQGVVAEICGVSIVSIYRASRRGWRAGRAGHPVRPMPSDFAIQVRHLSNVELVAHYRTSTRAIARWRRELRERQA
ncbi:MAG TPA: hypothetical protein VD768_08700 [Sphingomicrobium sp.]|nr:hypothetical protein [Sphingomicrobium sp.]